jgi:hypothetical protein
MDEIYITFKCASCKRIIIVLADEYKKAARKKVYLSCVYCNCTHLKNKKFTDDLRTCFENSEKKK